MRRRARSNEKSGLPRAGVISLLFHIALIIILGLSARLMITKVVPSVYRVAIMPFSPPGDGLPKGGPGLTPPGQDLPAPAVEKPKPKGTKKPAEVVAPAKPEQKKAEQKKPEQTKPEKKMEKPPKADIDVVPKKQKAPDTIKKEETPPTEEESDKSLQEAIDEIHRKVAIEEIQRKVDEREGGGQGATGAGTGSSQGPIVASAGGGAGSGTGTGTGTGTGSGGGTPEQVYAGMVEAKIKKEWALPQNFPKGKSQLETIIVIIIERDGRVQKSWFEKKSGDALYDQMAMRAIKKAEPLPPIPKAITANPFVIGIRFRPD
jgi:colicin import membrane protein